MRFSTIFHTKKMAKGTSKKMTSKTTSLGLVSRPAELMGKDSSTMTVFLSVPAGVSGTCSAEMKPIPCRPKETTSVCKRQASIKDGASSPIAIGDAKAIRTQNTKNAMSNASGYMKVLLLGGMGRTPD